jgi:hypothetical protein
MRKPLFSRTGGAFRKSRLGGAAFGQRAFGDPFPLPEDHPQNVVLANDEAFLAGERHVTARVLGEEHAVADLHVERAHGSVLLDFAVADGDDLPFERFFLRRIGNEDAPGGLRFLVDASAAKSANQWSSSVLRNLAMNSLERTDSF